MKYIIGIDQSTQGTKAILVDQTGKMAGRSYRKHRQIINNRGWVSHDLEEIYQNVISVVRSVIEENKIHKEEVAAIGISNQRESTAAWKKDGTPIGLSVVWQCDRAKNVTERLEKQISVKRMIEEKTGLPLSPYFPAAKMAWLIENQIPKNEEQYCLGTMDAYLVYRLTDGACYATDVSNASRTQLFDLDRLTWDEEICGIFHICAERLPKVCDSNAQFGETTCGGYFDIPVPILSVMGDSHAALYSQGCHRKGMVKATYGTGSSVMMNTGEKRITSKSGLVSSVAWGSDGGVMYVLEGNINCAGAVISWLADDVGLIMSPEEAEPLAARANKQDKTVLVPAFTGLSAPYWDNDARALLTGMSRTTGKAEIVKAAVESIGFQITDILRAMERDSEISIAELRVDGGAIRNGYLMQFQSDMAEVAVKVPEKAEFSALGAAYMAGIKAGIYDPEQIFSQNCYTVYEPAMSSAWRQEKYKNWEQALKRCRS